jgi:leucine-rich repeat protein SHOC2
LKLIEKMSLFNCLCCGSKSEEGTATKMQTIFHLEDKKLTNIPKEVFNTPNTVVELWVHNNNLTGLPDASSLLSNMELLYVNGNDIADGDLQRHGQHWHKLQELNLSGNIRITQLPDGASHWVDLRQIYLNDLPQLHYLNNSATASSSSSSSVIRYWLKLKVFHANNSGLIELCEDVGSLVNLTQVSICNNSLKTLPSSIGNWKCLEKLFLNDNQLICLPESISLMSSLTRLYVNGNQLKKLPDSIGQLTQLEELYAGDNQLVSLPPALSHCICLNKLFIPNNQIEELICVYLPLNLELINLKQNKLKIISDDFWSIVPRLKFLELANNQLTSFPFANMKFGELRTFDVTGNEVLVESYADELSHVSQNLIKPWHFNKLDA